MDTKIREDAMAPFYDDDVAPEVTRLLAFDPLAAAERKTGVSGHDLNGAAVALGFVASMEHNQAVAAILKVADDTDFSQSPEEYRRILREEGFARVVELPFEGEYARDVLEIWWNAADALLLRFDTFARDSVNSATVYYNWIPSPDLRDWRRYTSSGGLHEVGGVSVWVGDHDARQALRLKLRNLRACGAFASPWLRRPHLWLAHHMDKRDNPTSALDFWDALSGARLAMLPPDVLAAISPAKVTA